MEKVGYRVEEDILGVVEIPINAYYGISTVVLFKTSKSQGYVSQGF